MQAVAPVPHPGRRRGSALGRREPGRDATVVAVEDCEVVALNEHQFIELIEDAPYFALDVMRTLVERLRSMNRRL